MMNIGLIGCGRVANGHMDVYSRIKDAKVMAVSDINVDRARFFAENHGIDKAFADYRDLLEIRDLDFVDICTPTSTHAQIACSAAEFGHNILLEKPMALSTFECEKMIHKSEKHGVSLCMCHNQIFFPAIRRAKLLLDLGYYDLVSFRTSIKENAKTFSIPTWNVSPEERGIIWEAGCHPAYLQLLFLKDITDVYAVGSKVKYPVHDEFSVLLRTSHQSYGIIEVSWATDDYEKIYEINTSDGKRVYAEIHRDYSLLIDKSEMNKNELYFLYARKLLQYFIPKKDKLDYFIGHYHLINSFMESLKQGSPPPVTPQEGKKTIRLLECIEESLNRNEVAQVS